MSTAIGPDERQQLAEPELSRRRVHAEHGRQGLTGEEGYTTLERRWARPTCDINGLTSGYQGEGAKTVLPAKASAKFSFRLVPKQDPVKLRRELEAFLRQFMPRGIEMELIGYHGAPGRRGAARQPLHRRGQPGDRARLWPRAGLSSAKAARFPVVSTFPDRLGVDTLLLGWGLNDDNTHSPNEKFCLGRFPSRNQGQRVLGKVGENAGCRVKNDEWKPERGMFRVAPHLTKIGPANFDDNISSSPCSIASSSLKTPTQVEESRRAAPGPTSTASWRSMRARRDKQTAGRRPEPPGQRSFEDDRQGQGRRRARSPQGPGSATARADHRRAGAS